MSESKERIIQKLREENERLKLELSDPEQMPVSREADSANSVDPEKTPNDIFSSQIAFWNYSFTEKSFNCSEKLYDLLEIPTDTELKKVADLIDCMHPADKDRFAFFIKQLPDKQSQKESVFQLRMKDGSSRFVEIKTVLRYNNDVLTSMYGTVYDVTDFHYNNARLMANEKLYKNLFNKVSDIFILFEIEKNEKGDVTNYRFLDINNACEMKLGVSREQILNQPLSGQEELYEMFKALLKITAITGEPQQDRFYIPSLDSFFDVLIYTPEINTVATLWKDVTFTINAHTSLRESEEKYRQIFNIEYDGHCMVDMQNGKILDINPSLCNMVGAGKEKLLDKDFSELFENSAVVKQDLLEHKKNQFPGELKYAGEKLATETSVSYFNWSGKRVALLTLRDISERVATQEKLVKSEQKYKQLFNYSKEALLIVKNFRIINNNLKANELFQTNPKGLLQKTLWDLSPTTQQNGDESRNKLVEAIQRSLSGKQSNFDWQFMKKNKSLFYANVRIAPIFIDDEKNLQIIIQDISLRKQIESDLKIKESRWKDSLEISQVGVWEWNVINNKVYFSSEWKKILGFDRDELPNKFEEFERRVHPDDVAMVYNNIESYFSGKTLNYDIIFRMRCKNGSYKWINSLGKIKTYNEEGKAEKFAGTHIDVSRFILKEEELSKRNKKYMQSMNLMQAGYWDLNLKSMLISAPRETFSIFGIEASGNSTLKKIESLVHPEDQRHFIAQFIRKKDTKSTYCSFRILLDNATRYILSSASPYFDANNSLEGYSGVFQDITTLKKEEVEFKAEQRIMNTYMEKANHAILLIQEQSVVYANDKIKELSGFSSTDFEKNSIELLDIVTMEDKPLVQNMIEKTLSKSSGREKSDIRIETKFKRVKWVELIVSGVKYQSNDALIILLYDITTRKETELKARNELRTMEHISHNNPMGVAILDLNYKIVYANSEFRAIISFGHDGVKKMQFNHLFHETELTSIQSTMDAIANGRVFQYTNEIKLMNQVWVNLKIIPNYDISGELVSYTMYLENIDIKKNQIEMLTEENLVLRSVIDHATAGVGLFNKAGELINQNELFFEVLNLNTINKSTLHFSDLNVLYEQEQLDFKDLFELKETMAFEQNLLPGQTIFVEIRTVDLFDEKAILVVVKDITINYERNMKLIANIEKYQSLFEQADQGMALLDKDRNIILCNDSYAKVFDTSSNALKDQKLDKLISTKDLSELISAYSELYAGVKTNVHSELEMFTTTNESKFIHSHIAPFRNKYQEIIYGIQIIEDISEEKIAGEKRIVNERLLTLNHIANGFAHVFNNLLMGIYGNAHLIKTSENNQNIKKYATQLLDITQKAAFESNKLLTFSADKGRMDTLFDLNEIIMKIVEGQRSNPELGITTVLDEKARTLKGDPVQLERVFQSLVQNAFEAMPDGGELSIESKTVYFEQENDHSGQGGVKSNKYLRINITDTGTGIEKRTLEKVFDPFFTTKDERAHAGLGLSLSQKIVEDHQGHLLINNNEKKGAMVSLYLPYSEIELNSSASEPNELELVNGSINAMLVDDEEMVRTITSELLKKLGCNIFSFESGKKAIEFFARNSKTIDIVFLDKYMPEMDGELVYKELIQHKPDQNIVLLTGFNISDELINTFSSPNCSIIQKPVSIEKLVQIINQLVL